MVDYRKVKWCSAQTPQLKTGTFNISLLRMDKPSSCCSATQRCFFSSLFGALRVQVRRGGVRGIKTDREEVSLMKVKCFYDCFSPKIFVLIHTSIST